jgi:hypothetical protein
MRLAIVIMMVLISVNVTFAADLGSSRAIIKKNIPVWSGPIGQGNKTDCGEDKASACEIAGLPFTSPEGATTVGMANDYDVACPFTGSSAPDFVYSFIPGNDIEISVDLCPGNSSTYDTKVYIVRDSDDNTIACNDDFYEGEPCGDNVSYIASAQLTGGVKYYIIVDGYGEDAGPFYLNVAEVVPPAECVVPGPVLSEHIAENEPALIDDYTDTYNSGCALDSGMPPFQELLAYLDTAELNFYGKSGWYMGNGSRYRDTDWFTAIFDDLGLISWEVTAEQRMTMYRLTTGDCDNLHVIAQATVVPCETQRLVMNGEPGDVAWLWLGPESYDPPAGFAGNEFNYIMELQGMYGTFDGLYGVAVEATTWDSVKAMYR